jgi:hypothetical protein
VSMHRVWRWLRRHPVATSLFAVLWLATWVVTVLTWERDATGYSIGMSPSAIPPHLVLPLLLGIIVGLYTTAAAGLRTKRCAVAGLVFGLVEFGILALVDLAWLPQVEAEQPFGEMVVGSIIGAILYAGGCAVLGVLGGGLYAGLAARSGPR